MGTQPVVGRTQLHLQLLQMASHALDLGVQLV